MYLTVPYYTLCVEEKETPTSLVGRLSSMQSPMTEIAPKNMCSRGPWNEPWNVQQDHISASPGLLFNSFSVRPRQTSVPALLTAIHKKKQRFPAKCLHSNAFVMQKTRP